MIKKLICWFKEHDWIMNADCKPFYKFQCSRCQLIEIKIFELKPPSEIILKCQKIWGKELEFLSQLNNLNKE